MNTLVTVKLAHDLRNLLTIMSRCVDSIQARSTRRPVDDVDHAFAELGGAIDGAFAISRELLALAKPREAEPSIIDVNELVMEAQGVIRRILGDQIALSLDLRAVDPIVEAELVHVEWLLLNLVVNARDAMPDGGTLKISTESIENLPGTLSAVDDRPHRYVHLYVTDTGHGAVPSDLEKAFEPFASTRSGRVGFGLTSVAMTVQALKGRLQIQSVVAVGTSVHVHLPLFGRTRR